MSPKPRLLILSSLFPPDIIGGAEISAFHLAHWLRRQGLEVGVLTTAKKKAEICANKDEGGLKIWRVWMPRAYPVFYFAKGQKRQKPFWHLQDHFDPRNRKIAAQVMDAFQPDILHIHVLQGLGYNVLREINARRLPFIYFLHDLHLACIRTSMYTKKGECRAQCLPCAISSLYKRTLFSWDKRVSFCSPSAANLEKLATFFPVRKAACAVIFNANTYPPPQTTREASTQLRVLYVGRLAAPKGVDVLLASVRGIAEHYPVHLTIVGTGSDEGRLRQAYESFAWCDFKGFISQQEISDLMENHDVLCVPSVWAENLPGVIVHALTLGLPVIASNKGGIPELVAHEKNGFLVPAGDVPSLYNALEKVIKHPELLTQWSAYARATADRFNPDILGTQILCLIEKRLREIRGHA